MNAERKTGGFGTVVLIGLVLLVGGACALWVYLRREKLADNERSASAALKTLAVQSVDFRSNDRDENKINDFWTGDVAGLYYLTDRGTPREQLRLIERGLADADPSPAGTRPGRAVPFHGYWFRAMELDEDGKPYRQDTSGTRPLGSMDRNTSKFGFCAYPADYGRTGRSTYIINEGYTPFKRDTRGEPVLRFPSDSELKSNYSKYD